MLLWWRSASLLLRHPLPPWLPSSSYLQLLVYFSPFPLYESFFEAIDINKQTAILAWHDVLRVACCRWGSILPTWFALHELRAQASERVQANRQRRAVSVAFPLAPLSRSLARSLARSLSTLLPLPYLWIHCLHAASIFGAQNPCIAPERNSASHLTPQNGRLCPICGDRA